MYLIYLFILIIVLGVLSVKLENKFSKKIEKIYSNVIIFLIIIFLVLLLLNVIRASVLSMREYDEENIHFLYKSFKKMSISLKTKTYEKFIDYNNDLSMLKKLNRWFIFDDFINDKVIKMRLIPITNLLK